jgi:hypothetical protein
VETYRLSVSRTDRIEDGSQVIDRTNSMDAEFCSPEQLIRALPGVLTHFREHVASFDGEPAETDRDADPRATAGTAARA